MTDKNPLDPAYEHLGPFKIVRRLAQGGMAEVYLGINTGSFKGPERVVLKVWRPPPDAARREENEVQDLLSRLIEEGRLGSRLHHPSIVQTFGVMEDAQQQVYYLVQEYVDGLPLGDLMDHFSEARLKVPYPVILQVVFTVLQGLHHAYHTAAREDGRPLRVVHRDVKPDNIMLGYGGDIKLVDFGVARSTSMTRPVTVADLVLGTRHYMAPEQLFEPDQVGHRSDLFSVAVIALELCSLEPVFPRTSAIQEYVDALSGFRPEEAVLHLRSEAYPGMREVLVRALARHPADRYPGAQEMMVEIERLMVRAPGWPTIQQFAGQLKTIAQAGWPAQLLMSMDQDTSPLHVDPPAAPMDFQAHREAGSGSAGPPRGQTSSLPPRGILVAPTASDLSAAGKAHEVPHGSPADGGNTAARTTSDQESSHGSSVRTAAPPREAQRPQADPLADRRVKPAVPVMAVPFPPPVGDLHGRMNAPHSPGKSSMFSEVTREMPLPPSASARNLYEVTREFALPTPAPATPPPFPAAPPMRPPTPPAVDKAPDPPQPPPRTEPEQTRVPEPPGRNQPTLGQGIPLAWVLLGFAVGVLVAAVGSFLFSAGR